MCKMTPISVRLNLKNSILMSCGVLELLRKVSQGGTESDFTTWTTTVTSNNITFQLYSIKGAIELKLYFVKAFV